MMKFSVHTLDIVNEFCDIEDEIVKQHGLITSPPVVMASAAGWYVGQLCRDYHDGPDLLQPYAKLTDYMTRGMAIKTYEGIFK